VEAFASEDGVGSRSAVVWTRPVAMSNGSEKNHQYDTIDATPSECESLSVARIPTAKIAIEKEDTPMHMSLSIAPLVALIAGILILVMPRLLNYIVALYLILIGLLGLLGSGNVHF
jgi:hypothetical protein